MSDFWKGLWLILKTLDWFDWFYLSTTVFFGVIGGMVADMLMREFGK